jgi:hypothetical protein
MTFKAPTTVLGWVKLAAIAFALAMVASWTASQCRYWKTPKPPETISGSVDTGAPVAGPSSDRPTISTDATIARPALTREELLAEAKRVGLELELAPARPPGKRSKAPAGSTPEPTDSGSVNETAPPEFPIFFAKERFTMGLGDAGEVAVEVQAWQLEPGAKIDLRGRWEDYTPPPKPPAAASVTCPDGGFFGNEGKWEKEIVLGAVANEDGAGPGGGFFLTYRGPRTGRANWGVKGSVIGGKVGEKTPIMGLTGAKVSW